MSTGLEFTLEGLEELEEDLKKAIKKCPAQAETTLKRVARKFKNSAQKRAESELMPHNSDSKKAINANWGIKTVGENQGITALVYNSARHFHLIEDGHNLVKGDKIIGFVGGKHIMEKTRNEYKEIVPKEFQKMVDNILKESDLD